RDGWIGGDQGLILKYKGGSGTSVELPAIEETVIPVDYQLLQNYPNPFNPETTIQFNIQKSSPVSLAIYDISGSLIKTLSLNRKWDAGTHALTWNGMDENNRPVASGVYLYRIQIDTFTQTKRCLLLK
ncbi:hypothetical protein BVY01_00245, partial [bacterium I07]